MAFKVKLNRRGVESILKSERVQADLRARASRIAAAAGPGMVASVGVGRNRARAAIITGTEAARDAEARDRALTRALDAGRLR